MIRRGLVASVAALLASSAIWFWALAHIDPAATVPVHWGPHGPDRFAPGAEALRYMAIFPLTIVLVAVAFVLAPRFEPFRRNLEMSERAYLTTWIGVDLLMVAITFVMAVETMRDAPAEGRSDLLFRGIIAGTFLMMTAIADAMPKTRRNFMLGFRTRWTLTSDLAWEKTHRLAGRLMFLVGLWGIAAAFLFDLHLLPWAITLPVFAIVLGCTAYSYFVWRDDPNRSKGDIEHA